MNWPERGRWAKLFGAARDESICGEWYDRVSAAYAEPHRFYHNQLHIAECLAEFDSARNVARAPLALEFALWFHDIVYDPRAPDNEERSAALAKQCLTQTGMAPPLSDLVGKLIMATKTHESFGDADMGLIIDIDLSILGRPKERFLDYEKAIRDEYAWVPAALFAEKRSEILRRFLARPRIFNTEFFFDKFEKRARENLKLSLSLLGQKAGGGA